MIQIQNAYDWSALPAPGPAPGVPVNDYFVYWGVTPDVTNQQVGFANLSNFESVKFYQGTCHNNQTTKNQTKQSYMSCLEDGTKKVNFT